MTSRNTSSPGRNTASKVPTSHNAANAEENRQVITGNIFDIQRFCVHDGPGIRTTVFFKGCPLRCVWCHNPEGIAPNPQLSFTPERCIGCGACLRVCPHQAHRMDDQAGHVLDRSRCRVCGACAAECNAQALTILGRTVTVDEVIAEAIRDRAFYATSGGGLTLSGGEPTMQIEFAEALLVAAKAHGLHCCVETCGMASLDRFKQILPYTDLLLYDLKETDNARHKEFAGAPNTSIIENLRSLHDLGENILLRLPIIPGYNDREDHFAKIAELARSLPNLAGVEMLPYHRLGEGKRQRLGMAEPASEPEPPDEQTVRQWADTFARLGVRLVPPHGQPSD